MNYELFLDRCKARFPDDDYAMNMVNRFREVFSDECFGDCSRLRDLFYIKEKIGKSQFFKIKCYVKEFYLFLYEQGYVTQEQLSIVQQIKLDEITMSCEVKQNYFKDIYDAIDFVQAVGSMFGMNDKNDLLIIKSIVILSWYGVEASAMTGIRKADLCPDSNSVRIDGGLTVVMPRECFSILYRLSVIDEYRGFPSGKKQTCVNSPYLFRTFRSEQTDRSKINQAVKRFNNEASDLFDRKIAMSALKNNRIFCQMLECEDQSSCGLTSLLKEIAGKDRHAAVWYKSMYKTWKDVYYPNGGGVL